MIGGFRPSVDSVSSGLRDCNNGLADVDTGRLNGSGASIQSTYLKALDIVQQEEGASSDAEFETSTTDTVLLREELHRLYDGERSCEVVGADNKIHLPPAPTLFDNACSIPGEANVADVPPSDCLKAEEINSQLLPTFTTSARKAHDKSGRTSEEISSFNLQAHNEHPVCEVTLSSRMQRRPSKRLKGVRGYCHKLRKRFQDEHRDCGFELATICFPWSRRFTPNAGSMEADAYRSELRRLQAHRKARIVLFNLVFGVIDPTGAFRMLWDGCMLLALLYIMLMVPIYIGFSVSPRVLAEWLHHLDMVVLFMFILDVLLNLRTGYLSPASGKVIRKRGKILRRYATGWMAIDLITAIPFDLILDGVAGSANMARTSRLPKLVKFLRIIRLVKLLRIMKLSTVVHHIERAIGKSWLRMALFFLSGAMVAHFMACTSYWVADLVEPDEAYPGWTEVLMDGEEAWGIGQKYTAALYWSFSTITTVGYGDIVPTNTPERVMAILCMVAGVTVFGYFMGNMTSIVADMNEAMQQHNKRVEAMEKFLRFRDIPPGLAARVRNYYKFLWERELQEDEKQWLDGLNATLRTEMVLYMFHDAINRTPFFNGKHPHFIAAMVQNLKPETYAPFDVVCRQGEPATSMYFVSRGSLNLCLRIADEVAQDILTGKDVPKMDTYTELRETDSTGKAHGDLERLRSSFDEHRTSLDGRNMQKVGSGSAAVPAVSSEHDSMYARQKILQAMKNDPRDIQRAQLRGGVRRRGASVQEDSDDETVIEEFSVDDEAIYIIPDDLCKIRSRRTSSQLHVDPDPLSDDEDGSGWNMESFTEQIDQEFYNLFSLSRRATQVHSDLEMIEAVSLMGNGAHAYRRMGVLRPGTYFGEYSCLLGLRRTITVVAQDFVEVFAMQRKELDMVLEDWPDIAAEFRNMVDRAAPTPKDGGDIWHVNLGSGPLPTPSLRPPQNSVERPLEGESSLRETTGSGRHSVSFGFCSETQPQKETTFVESHTRSKSYDRAKSAASRVQALKHRRESLAVQALPKLEPESQNSLFEDSSQRSLVPPKPPHMLERIKNRRTSNVF